ncbi:MAG: glutathione S-transferase family protein [Pacificimonas sp.]
MKIVLGNKRYSSWSLRGWLAVKQTGRDFEEVVIPMDTPEWYERKTDAALMPSGKVPTLWDGDTAVWDSLAIVDWLADRFGQVAYWPIDGKARALARSMAAEMHSGFTGIRTQCPMDVCRTFEGFRLEDDTKADVTRIEKLWTAARERHGEGGPYLFGAFGAADMMFAPVVMRSLTYGIDFDGVAGVYRDAIGRHPWITEWVVAAKEEPEAWAIDKYADLAKTYLID